MSKTQARKTNRVAALQSPNDANLLDGADEPLAQTEPKPVSKRLRLAPEVRADLILDSAARLILADGFTEVSMERIGRDAGVSKALIYNYFPNLSDLLRALLTREVVEVRKRGILEIASAGNFADLLRRTTRMYLAHVQERGPLLQRLWKESSVARSVTEVDQRGREETLRYFVKRVRKEYDLPLDIAVATVDMQMAMTEAAAQHLTKTNYSIDLVTDICVRHMIGGLEALAKANQLGAPSHTE